MRFCFGTMCSACAERDAHCVRDVAFGSDVHFAREDAEHITSLCAEGAIHHCGEAITSLRRSRYITLYKRPKVCYNKIRKAVEIWQKQLCQNKNSSINGCVILPEILIKEKLKNVLLTIIFGIFFLRAIIRGFISKWRCCAEGI